ncbi:MAG: IS607 family transposase [Acidimicrobiales bacterium]
MKLSEWAKQNGVSRQSATRWFHAGVLPVPAHQLPTGTILVDEDRPAPAGVAVYARVSSSDQRADLDRQVARLTTEATGRQLAPTKVVAEVGSGLNGHRSRPLSLLRDPAMGTIVVEHRDRLARFGVEYLEAAHCSAGAAERVVVIEDAEVTDDLVRDMVEVLTSLCAHCSAGVAESAKRRAEAALVATQSGQAA